MQGDPASSRRPPMAQAYVPRAAPPPRPYYQGAAPDPRYPPPSSTQSYTDPSSPTHYAESVVSDAGSEQWPLPARPVGQSQPRSHSPAANGRRRQQRPPRDHYQYPPSQSRHHHRGRHPPGSYQHGPPRHPHSSEQWHGDGHNTSQSGYRPSSSHHPPPPRAAQPPGQPFAYAPQGFYHQPRNPRYPPGAPAPSRNYPSNYNRESQPVAQEATPDANWPPDLSLIPLTAIDSDLVKIPSYYFGDPDATEPENSVATSIDENHDSPMESQLGSERGGSRAEQRHAEQAAPIRHASLGKKARPTMATVVIAYRRNSSADANADQSDVPQTQPSEREHRTHSEEELDALPGAWISEGPTPDEHHHREQVSEHGSDVAFAASTGERGMDDEDMNDAEQEISSPRRSSHLLGLSPVFADSAPPDSQSELPRASAVLAFQFTETEDRDVPLSPVTDTAPNNDTHHEPVSPIEPEDFLSPLEAHMDRSEKRRTRPSDLDMEAIREAESRGSMTSLPDLIRRATTLCTNLDRGKTASRLGMNWFLNNSESDVDMEKSRANARKSGSISDMLTASVEARKSLGNFSSMLRLSRMDPAAPNAKKASRKYCGMPLWLCLVLLVLVILLIAAAVVIPVVLIVIPKQQQTAATHKPAPTSSNHLTALQQCENTLACQNSGINIITKDGPCSCLCVDGYTGKACTEQSSSGCSTMPVSNGAAQATVGDHIKDLIQSAEQSYNIPLNAEMLLGLFSSSDLTCAAENDLVNFSLGLRNSRSIGPSPVDLASPTVDRRRRTRSRLSAAAAAAASSSSSASTTTPASSPRDFAGAAVLYIFQETGEHSSATEAQEKFQGFFSHRRASDYDGANPSNISLGNGFSCDLPQRRLVWRLQNGTVVSN